MNLLKGFFFPRVGKQTGKLSLDSLPCSIISSNWRLPDVKQPTFLVNGKGAKLESLSQKFVEKISEKKGENQALTFAGEMVNTPEESRPFRVLTQIQLGYVVATDVLLRREGSDLYVKYTLRARTTLAYLRFLWLSFIFLILLALFLAGYLKATNARETWAKDYADKHAALIYPSDPDAAAFLTRRVLNGYYETDWVEFRKDYAQNKKLVQTAGEYFNEYGYPGPINELKYFANITTSREVSDAYRIQETLKQWRENDLVRAVVLEEEDYYDRFPEYLIDYYLKAIPGDLFFQIYLYKQEEVEVQFSTGGGLFGMRPSNHSEHVLQAHFTHWVNEAEIRKTLFKYYEVEGLPEMEEIQEIFDKHTKWNPPMSTLALFRADPRGALFNFTLPVMFVAALLGALIWRSPLSWLRLPCQLLGWTFPDDFNNASVANLARVMQITKEALGLYDMSHVTELSDK